MATKVELRNQVLQELEVLPAGQTASAEDAVTVETRIDQVYAFLEDKEIAYWDANNIPAEVMRPMVKIVAYECAPAFQLPPDKIALHKAQHDTGMRDLYAHVAAQRGGEPIKATYY